MKDAPIGYQSHPDRRGLEESTKFRLSASYGNAVTPSGTAFPEAKGTIGGAISLFQVVGYNW
jgi:hypothetical protein